MLTDLTYLAYPLPEDIERLVYTGDLSRALRVIEMPCQRQSAAGTEKPSSL